MGRPSQAPRTVLSTDISKLDIIPSTSCLTETAELLETRIRREERLANALELLSEEYDYIVIDCPPILGNLTYNVIVAANLTSKSVSIFARSSRGAKEYDALCTDILRLRIKS